MSKRCQNSDQKSDQKSASFLASLLENNPGDEKTIALAADFIASSKDAQEQAKIIAHLLQHCLGHPTVMQLTAKFLNDAVSHESNQMVLSSLIQFHPKDPTAIELVLPYLLEQPPQKAAVWLLNIVEANPGVPVVVENTTYWIQRTKENHPSLAAEMARSLIAANSGHERLIDFILKWCDELLNAITPKLFGLISAGPAKQPPAKPLPEAKILKQLLSALADANPGNDKVVRAIENCVQRAGKETGMADVLLSFSIAGTMNERALKVALLWIEKNLTLGQSEKILTQIVDKCPGNPMVLKTAKKWLQTNSQSALLVHYLLQRNQGNDDVCAMVLDWLEKNPANASATLSTLLASFPEDERVVSFADRCSRSTQQ
ncbi:MAG TPA: hypothetical protein V6D17_00365 [Candidatus Obscuribacterales bacterium]